MSLLDGWMMGMRYQSEMDGERRKRRPANLRGETACVRCGMCCVRRTCIPLPDEIPAIAEFLGLTVEELIKQYMVADRTGGEDVAHLKWANTAQRDVTGTFLSWCRTYDIAPCIFMDEDGICTCRIWEARPQNARNTACWSTESYPGCGWQKADIEQFAEFVDLRDPDSYWDDDYDYDEED